jgi:hypothetical protein
MKSRLFLVIASAAPLLALGCGGASGNAPQPNVASARGNAVAIMQNEARALPYAPAGTTFDAQLDQTLDTRLSSPGDRVTATLTQPIRTSTGEVIVPAGTQLHGRIAAITQLNGPQLVLDFDSLALADGKEVPVGVHVLAAEQSHYRSLPGPSGVTSMQEPEGQQQGANPAAPEEGQLGTPQLSMTKGAVLHLSLTSPIIDAHTLK